MGFFVPDFLNPTVDQYDKSKYFMMVNRRCVPDTPSNGHGDLRQLKIKFDSTQLPGFRNWKIIEMDYVSELNEQHIIEKINGCA